MHEFEAKLVKPDISGSWTYLTVPFDVEKSFGSRARVQVKGTVNGIPYKGTLMPHGDGKHYMVVNKALRDLARATNGDKVKVTMEQDHEKREVEASDDFLAVLNTNEKAEANYNNMAYSHKKAYVDWIEGSKRPETRQSRIQKSVEKLADGIKLK
ncbi:YdeI/OmpD-associated family protein [Paenibacillus sp. BR2-3]|uniref:DUF1905 domain-containing protein n=1 Tax=Paenibacillus sp. BR2-3 TaxID=3048494 RepID=UPI003977E064